MQNTAGGGGGGGEPLHPYSPAIFGYKNPTTHVLRQSVSQSLGSIRGSGDENAGTKSFWLQ